MIPREWATRAQIYSVINETAADEPLIVDMRLPLFSDPSRHAIVLRLDGLVTIPATGRMPDIRGIPPNSGLFLCPQGTPIETLADAQAGLLAEARPLAIPLNDPFLDVSQIGAGFGIQIAAIDLPLVVPKNHFLRMIINARQGAATPGPGAGSIGRLRAQIVSEDDIDRTLC